MVPPLRGATIGPDARWVDGREARPINPDRTDANAPLIRPIIHFGEDMKKIFFCMVAYLAFIGNAHSAEFKLVNLDVLGSRITNAIQIFSSPNQEGVEPGMVSFITHKGKISVVEVTYPSNINFEDVRRAIDNVYGKYKHPDQGPANNPMAVWIINKSKIEIQMQRNKNNLIEVTYLTNESFEW